MAPRITRQDSFARPQGQNGFSLPGVLVATAIVGIIGYFLADMFVNASKSSQFVAARYAQSDLFTNISQVINDRKYCKTAMNNASNAVVKIQTGASEVDVSKILQVIGTQETLVAKVGAVGVGGLNLDSMKLEYKKDASGAKISPEANKPSAGQATHHMNLILKTSQSSGSSNGSFSFKDKVIPLTIVANQVTGDIIECQSNTDFVGEGGVIWSKTITSPNFPLVIDIPAGVKGLKMDMTVFQVVQLPGDVGRTVGSRFNYSTDGGGSGTWAVSEIGAGNNNGGQARFYGTTSGVIPINDSDTKVTITRQGYLLDQNGNPISGQGMFQAPTVTFLGLDKAPESPPPPPPPTGPVGGPSGPGGPSGGWDDYCFVAGTEIQMADGSAKAIEDVLVGDQVMSRDEDTGKLISRTVTKLHHHPARIEKIHEFVMEDGSVVSPNAVHPMYVVEKDGYYQAHQIAEALKMGLKVSLLRGDGASVRVVNVRVRAENLPLFNFEVDGISRYAKARGYFGRGHNYYADGFLVHNAIYGSSFAKIILLPLPGLAMQNYESKN